MTVERFDFSFAPAYRATARVFAVGPATAWVEVGSDRLEARFGPWCVSTPITNIVGAAITGPYAFVKTAGPARLAITDRGLTFASNGVQGVLITFDRSVRGIDPFGLIRHRELTVTVREPDGLVAVLKHRTVSRTA